MSLSKVRLAEERPETLSEYIGLVDYSGQDLYTGDLVVIENELITKQFRVIYSKEKLAYCFQTEDQEQAVYSWQEIKGIFGKDFTVTKTGNIFIQGG